MKLTQKQIEAKLKKLELINDEGVPVLYSVFKNRSAIHRYKGRKHTYKIVFIGIPKDNLFGFYAAFANDSDTNVMKEAYKNFLKLAKGNMEDFNEGIIQWGNCGLPIVYKDLVSQ